mmetsp:Transcript_48977/g.127830  ORF Transcript_48977/g.127830 Transcript_48977/m.127830 type:complete len:218 (-) Transcript_48977:41-694(-)
MAVAIASCENAGIVGGIPSAEGNGSSSVRRAGGSAAKSGASDVCMFLLALCVSGCIERAAECVAAGRPATAPCSGSTTGPGSKAAVVTVPGLGAALSTTAVLRGVVLPRSQDVILAPRPPSAGTGAARRSISSKSACMSAAARAASISPTPGGGLRPAATRAAAASSRLRPLKSSPAAAAALSTPPPSPPPHSLACSAAAAAALSGSISSDIRSGKR